MSQEPALDPSSDDFYLSALFSEDEIDLDGRNFPVSDAMHAEELQLQEALMESMHSIKSQISLLNLRDVASSSSSSSSVQQSRSELRQLEEKKVVESGVGQSSFCEICVERKENAQMFTIEHCSHFFCKDCISKHVAARLQYNTQTVIKCPALNCEGVIEFDSCRSIISKDVLEMWDERLCESLIHASQKFYCPFKDCSAMLIRDTDEVITESECPMCWRLFCAQCSVSWHSGIGCEEFQRLNKDERGREDLMLMELAKAKSWNRCPRCKYYVEKSQGCIHMTCRCGFQFCYACGGTWSSTHGGCQQR